MLLFIPPVSVVLFYDAYISIHLMLLFIEWQHLELMQGRYFNTSHVTVYQMQVNSLRHTISDFNTSHVTVYLKGIVLVFRGKMISIHLMLLFIVDTGTNLVKKFKFQYISCYCLSPDFPTADQVFI